jgi:hypothetical protein
MTRIDFDGLRSRYQAALDTYRVRATRVAELTKGGEQPPESVLRAEEQALWELATVRRELLDALAELSQFRH